MYRKIIINLFSSFALIFIWGLGLLNIPTSNIKASLAFIATITMVAILYYKKYQQYLLFVGPVIYVVASLILGNFNWFNNPVLVIFIVFTLAYALKGQFKFMFPLIVVSLLYSFINYDFPQKKETYIPEPTSIVTNNNLDEFRFINNQLDTIQLQPNINNVVLIETWNQTCRPCLASIKEMQNELSTLEGVDNYYLYQTRGERNLTIKQIFEYKKIQHKNKILIDINNNLFETLDLQSYPFFLIYNTQGELVNYRKGYGKKEEVLQELIQMIEEAKES